MLETILWGPVGAAAFIAYAALVIADHVRFLTSRTVLDQRGTIAILARDLVGFAWMFGWMHHLDIGPGWLRTFLWVHVAVHALSLVWTVAHFPSLEEGMRTFQARRMPRWVTVAMTLYEQSDPAIYFWLAATLAADLPPHVTLPLFIAIAGVGVYLKGPRRGAAEPEVAHGR